MLSNKLKSKPTNELIIKTISKGLLSKMKHTFNAIELMANCKSFELIECLEEDVEHEIFLLDLKINSTVKQVNAIIRINGKKTE